MTRTHELKTAPEYFAAVWSGDKNFEVRYDDRGYQTGDMVVLREWDPDACRTGIRPCDRPGPHRDDCPGYSGRAVVARIGFTLSQMPGRSGGFRGDGWVVLSLCDPSRRERLDILAARGLRPDVPGVEVLAAPPFAHPSSTSAPSPADVARIHDTRATRPVDSFSIDQRTEGDPR